MIKSFFILSEKRGIGDFAFKVWSVPEVIGIIKGSDPKRGMDDGETQYRPVDHFVDVGGADRRSHPQLSVFLKVLSPIVSIQWETMGKPAVV